MLSHKDARIVVAAAFRVRMGREGTRPELQCAGGVGFLETGYAQNWKSPGVGSFNWGAIQGSGPAGAFQYTDTHPNADGTSTPYAISFRKYRSLEEGAEDLIRIVYQSNGRDRLVLPAATKGDTLAFSTAMHTTRYYEGFGRTVQERIANHHRALVSAITAAARAIGEPMPDGSELPPAPPVTIRQGSTGESVKAWQRTLIAAGFELVVDGAFGPRTAALTKSLQSELKLVADGVVGPATYAAAAKKFPTL
jgi:hypothetical protein